MTRGLALLARLHGDQRGVSVIELAFIAPLLALFLVGIIDGARAVSAKLTLDQTVYRALEKASVGTNQSDYSSILTSEVQNTSGYSSSDVITVSQWLECNLNGTKLAYDAACAPGQQSTRYIQLKVDRQFMPSYNYGKWFLGAASNGAVTMSSTSTLRMQ
jgi:Flp pilus assembly pilin Flp